jgi:hypothetical protein
MRISCWSGGLCSDHGRHRGQQQQEQHDKSAQPHSSLLLDKASLHELGQGRNPPKAHCANKRAPPANLKVLYRRAPEFQYTLFSLTKER